MSTEIIALILAIVGSATGATWVVAGKLADVESALKVQVSEFKALKVRVIRLEQKRSVG